MRRLTCIAIASLTLLATPTAEASRQRTGPCTGPRAYVTREMPAWEQHDHVRWLIACAVLQWPVPGGLAEALRVATRESGPALWPYAKNPSSSASGVYQFIDDTWDGLVAAWPVMNEWTGTWVFSARANVFRAIRTAHESGWCAAWC